MKPERGGGFSFLVHDFYFLFPSTSAYPYLRSNLLLGKQRRSLIDTVLALPPKSKHHTLPYLPNHNLLPAHSFHQNTTSLLTSLQTRNHAARTSMNRPHSPHPNPTHLQTTRKQNCIQKNHYRNPSLPPPTFQQLNRSPHHNHHPRILEKKFLTEKLGYFEKILYYYLQYIHIHIYTKSQKVV